MVNNLKYYDVYMPIYLLSVYKIDMSWKWRRFSTLWCNLSWEKSCIYADSDIWSEWQIWWKRQKNAYKGELKEYLKILLKYIKNSTKMFVLLKSIDLYSFQSDPAKKVRWADLWSYWHPSFSRGSLHNFSRATYACLL